MGVIPVALLRVVAGGKAGEVPEVRLGRGGRGLVPLALRVGPGMGLVPLALT